MTLMGAGNAPGGCDLRQGVLTRIVGLCDDSMESWPQARQPDRGAISGAPTLFKFALPKMLAAGRKRGFRWAQKPGVHSLRYMS